MQPRIMNSYSCKNFPVHEGVGDQHACVVNNWLKIGTSFVDC